VEAEDGEFETSLGKIRPYLKIKIKMAGGIVVEHLLTKWKAPGLIPRTGGEKKKR
jgi:hypothetical protein